MFTENRFYPECSNSENSKFKYTIELKFEDEKVLYKLAIVSNSKGVSIFYTQNCDFFYGCWEYVGNIKRKPLTLLENKGIFYVPRAGLEPARTLLSIGF